MWYEWKTIEAFDSWHKAICDKLGYPITPVNAETGLADQTAQKVIDYTRALIVGDKAIAWVDSDEATGLTPTELRPPTVEITEI
jgi:hypothetical protein